MKLNGVNKMYGKQKVLDDIHLELKRGVVTGLIGKNGAGKTTIMKILCGNIKNFEGEVERGQGSVGYLIEHPKAYMNESGRYNLKYFSHIYSAEPDHDYIKFLIQSLGMESYINKKVKGYSMGMKQRLGIAISMLRKPDYLILDEPTNGMDPDGSIEVLKTLKELSEQFEIGVLISSHKLEDVEMISDEIVFISQGKIKKTMDTGDLSKTGVIQIGLQPEDLEEGYAVISRSVETVEREGEEIIVPISVDLSALLKELAKEDIFPSNITKNSHTLKDYYFQMTESQEVAK
ncbi:ABC transporter ATP-binding protein [Halobacillus fulvus]|nr:ABC transporter ATP-binding protein [Halobacillus fulvus]